MRLYLTGLVLALLTSGPALAEVTRPMQATPGRAQLMKICTGDTGQTFSENMHGYSCTRDNCDGKGGSCTVSCSNDGKSCEGTTPDRILHPVSIIGILQNGNNIVFSKEPDTLGSAASASGESNGGVVIIY